MSRRYQHRKDGNHHVVVQAIERLGYYWWDASQTGLGVDGFAVGFGRLIPCEIKDPRSRRKLALSPHEHAIHRQLGARQVRVELLTGDNDSLDVLRGHARRLTANFHDPERNHDARRPADRPGEAADRAAEAHAGGGALSDQTRLGARLDR